MKIKRHAQRLSAFEDRPEEAVVEVAATDMAIDHRTLEADADAALEFPGGGARIRRRNRRKTGKSAGIPAHRLSDVVVGIAGKRYGLACF